MPQKSPFLLVSGFHRSGTSLVAQTLHSNGVNLGENLMGASFGNPNGHFEDLSIVELHDELLNLHGLDWQTTYSSTNFKISRTKQTRFKSLYNRLLTQLP